jgi:DNA-binding LytR/AlgR family response regulator
MKDQKIKVAIVDDEPIARDILSLYASKLTELSVAGMCSNAIEAMSLIKQQEVDLLLLDINMPEITGMQLAKSLTSPPLIIFTTAYSEFGAESYEVNAVDYLVKPISFERFGKAIEKAKTILRGKSEEAEKNLLVKTEGIWVKLELNKIIFIEGLKDYVRIYTTDQRLVIHSTMKNMEEELTSKGQQFLRVHKSFIVNKDMMSQISAEELKIGEHIIPVGNTYREVVKKLIRSF